MNVGFGISNPVSESMIAAGHIVDIAESGVQMVYTKVPEETLLKYDILQFLPSEQLDGMFTNFSLLLLESSGSNLVQTCPRAL